ncbi:hypothetical protein SBDP1_1350005 [Syntrophobacter sp. SbD1]|nr:hypothetical protein SBDP1_1350005 [Syntrophobacter sp. SbD1]
MNELHPIFYHCDRSRPIGWEDKKRNRNYRRLFGGLAWPQVDRPGFAVIVAEGLQDEGPHNPTIPDHVALYVLREVESGDFEQLMRTCIEHSRKVSWHGNMNHRVNMRLLCDFNRAESGAGRLQLSLMPAPFIYSEGDLREVFDDGIMRIRRRGQKGALILDDSPLLKARLDDVPRDKGVVNRAEEYPGLLALCFAVSALSCYPCVDPAGAGTPGQALTEYDPFEPNPGGQHPGQMKTGQGV